MKYRLSYILYAIKIWEEIPLDNNNNLDLAYCYFDVGLSYKEQDNHHKGMEYLIKRIEIFKLRKAQSELAFTYRYVGLIYKEL
jgi:tetratricopeptide (TPR) repeat protein